MSKKTVVNLVNVGKMYRNGPEELHILRGVDLELKQGSSIVITGESGCGKSTLLNLIGGLDAPSYGSIEVTGVRVDSASEERLNRYRNKQVGFIFQFHYLLKEFTALENVMLPAFMGGASKKDALERGEMLLNQVNLGQRKDFYPSRLSGGESQRVAVARALINQPDIILADEPTGNLDERHSGIVADLLFELTGRYNTTLIVVTHDMSFTGKAERHLTLREGVL